MNQTYLIIGLVAIIFIIVMILINKFKKKLTIYSYNQNIKYKLVKNNKNIINIYDILPLSIKNIAQVNKNTFLAGMSQNHDKRVSLFIDKIVTNFDDINLFFLASNINSVKINKLKLNSFNTIFSTIKVSSGEYNVKNNQIIYYDIKNSNNLEHELFHLSTARVEANFMCTGFAYYFDSTAIGYGLNEGYTQLLSNRYFYGVRDFYYYEKSMAFMIENIIGKEQMIKLYFNADLKGLIDVLSIYIDRDLVINLITNIDKFSNIYSYQDINNRKISKNIVDLLKEIQITLLKISYSKNQNLKINYISKFHDYEILNDSIINNIIMELS